VDTFSARTVVAQITRPEMTDEEKAIACWKFMLDHYYHWTPAKEIDVSGDVRDFAKAINSYGYGPCFQNAPVLTALWEACGFRTRCWTITGHTIPEVEYGGAWHLLDADARAFHRKADGAIASVRELSADAKLFTDPPGGKSDPFYPFGAPDAEVQPFVFWGPPSKMMDLYLSKKNNYQFNRRAVMGHPMYVTLRPGELLTLNRANQGKWLRPWTPPKKPMKPEFLANGPEEVSKKYTYGNGRLVWKPDLKTGRAEDILWMGSDNVTFGKETLIPANRDKPAVAVFRVWSPYALVEAEVSMGLTAGAGKLEVSSDEGAAWSELQFSGKGSAVHFGTVKLTDQVAGRYGYLLRVSSSAALSHLAFVNTFQLSQLALPRLRPGKNTVKVLRGPDEGHVQLVKAKGKPRKERYVVKSEGLEEKGMRPAKRDCSVAYGIYKLVAPAELVALSVGANITMDPGKAEQYIEALYSIDAGKTWTSVWKQPNHRNRDNSQFEWDRRVELENKGGAREALIKFQMARGSKYFGVNAVRLYGFYRQPQPAGAKLAVNFLWEEKHGEEWKAKSKSVVVDAFPHEFEIECAGEAARVKRIDMEPAP
jgi:hypothetical protein